MVLLIIAIFTKCIIQSSCIVSAVGFVHLSVSEIVTKDGDNYTAFFFFGHFGDKQKESHHKEMQLFFLIGRRVAKRMERG